MVYSPSGRKESDTTERLTLSLVAGIGNSGPKSRGNVASDSLPSPYLSAPATPAPATVKRSPLSASPSLHLSLYHSWESEHVIHPPKHI